MIFRTWHSNRSPVPAFDLDAEMIEARLLAARRDREIHARVVQHPFGIVGLDHAGSRGEERRIEANRLLEVGDGDVYMHAFHGATPSSRNLDAFLAAGRHSASGAQA